MSVMTVVLGIPLLSNGAAFLHVLILVAFLLRLLA